MMSLAWGVATGMAGEGGAGLSNEIKQSVQQVPFVIFGHDQNNNQCFGSGWIRIILPDPDPLQERLIWIWVVKKIRDKLAYK